MTPKIKEGISPQLNIFIFIVHFFTIKSPNKTAVSFVMTSEAMNYQVQYISVIF